MAINKKMIMVVAFILGIIAVIFYIAPSFDILERNVGIFIGVVFSILSGATWGFYGMVGDKEKKNDVASQPKEY